MLVTFHEPVEVLEGHAGDAVLVDHQAGAEGLHGVGQVGGQQPPGWAKCPTLGFRVAVPQLQGYKSSSPRSQAMPCSKSAA